MTALTYKPAIGYPTINVKLLSTEQIMTFTKNIEERIASVAKRIYKSSMLDAFITVWNGPIE